MTYNFDGKKYETASTHQREWGMKLITELNLQGTERVLDLGCGDGTLTAQIAELLPGGKVIGIDASQGMIDAAFPKTRKNLQFLIMDINELDFVDQFDIVFSNATLHWVKDHKRLLENVHRILYAGGRLRFNFAGDGNCSYFFKVVRETMSIDKFAIHFESFEWPWYMPSADEYSTLVKSNWPSYSKVWGKNEDRFFPNVDALVKWIDQPSIVPFLTHLPEAERHIFREIVVMRMIEETKRNDGRCVETFRRINVYGKKYSD